MKIYTYPDSVLRTRAEEVKEFDAELATLLDDMAETMYSSEGVGLAAPQAGVSKRVIVIDVSYPDGRSNLLEIVNPRIVETRGSQLFNEGCLSFPGVREEIKRADWARIEAFNRKGEKFTVEGDGILSVALQHEIDHLEGVLIIDHLSFLKRRLVDRQMRKSREK